LIATLNSTMKAPSVVIVIPIYKETLNLLEEFAIQQCFDILQFHHIVAIKPASLSLAQYNYPFDEVVSFNDNYFKDVAGYNRLMLSSPFYKTFLKYEFMLIYQPDAFVFRDDLLYWCNKGFDYIGAPWLAAGDYPDVIKKSKNKLLNFLHRKLNWKQPNSYLPTAIQLENMVGNGGLSLRRTEKFYSICIEEELLISHYNSKQEHYFHEDVFWSIEVNRRKSRLKIPSFKIAVYFSLENNCDFGFKLTEGNLPFGCHAWDKNLKFWKPIFAQHGITIGSSASHF